MTSALCVALLLATITVAWAAPPNPCFRAQMPNDDDPYSFYKCDAAGRPHLWRCAAGTMYDRRTEICDWEDQVKARSGQIATTGSGGNGGARQNGAGSSNRPNGGGASGRGIIEPRAMSSVSARYGYGYYGGYKDKDKIAIYVSHLDWKTIAKTAAYAYSKVKPLLESMHEDFSYHKYDNKDKQKGKDKGKGKEKGKEKDKGKGKNKEKPKESSEEEEEEEEEEEAAEDSYELPYKGTERNGGRRPNNRQQPGNREPGPLDEDYDNGEDWNEYERWRDEFREADNVGNGRGSSSRGPDRGREQARDTGNERPASRENNPCRTRPTDSAPRLFQNPDDCSTYFTCNMRRPVMTYCPRGYNFNPRRQGCDTSEPQGCRNVRGTQAPAEITVNQRSYVPSEAPTKTAKPSESAIPNEATHTEILTIPSEKTTSTAPTTPSEATSP